jgi:hypothetical protein
MVEREAEDGRPHGHAQAASPHGGHQPRPGVDGAQHGEAVGLDRLDTDDLSPVLDGEAQAPRGRRPGAHRAPVLLVHLARAVLPDVHPRHHLDAGVVLVVVRLDRGEVADGSSLTGR